ncbi:hypothetical protein JY651_07790 [Pyxidicoccus parkwayensis]|uniref:Bacterial Ig-like domain-containing protein n=1 Tax=Pyxidicoccus parkwayensis TaxID=2813578 RepID=A0ABX7P2Z5_9BACT|nr:Ig-like domain-containing protein [Pyxidicoccus parkwaysis]QSQ24832.1 hypothetical protein JY651_07790 [Pyxidicoccus parkwaysis]
MTRGSWNRAVLALAVLTASAAMAGPDTFFAGDGRSGPKTVAASTEEVVNEYAQVDDAVNLAPGGIVITLENSLAANTKFVSGALVMVMQATGLNPGAPAGDNTTIDLTGNRVGRWELARLSANAGGGSTLRLAQPLKYSYEGGNTQVIFVPEYTTVTIPSTSAIKALPWDGTKGGVVAFLARDGIANDGTISAKGAGFRGGVYDKSNKNGSADWAGCTATTTPTGSPRQVQASKGEGLNGTGYNTDPTLSAIGLANFATGGGGGICNQSGGGGGGNAGSGGLGGSPQDGSQVGRSGLGGTSVWLSSLESLAMGGGGGSGQGSGPNNASTGPNGANGGGIVFLRSFTLTGSGTIDASGDDARDVSVDSGGGGGAGGSVYARFQDTAVCGVGDRVLAEGGDGGNSAANTGPGGGGGGGWVLFQAKGSPCGISVVGGVAGQASGGGLRNALPASTGNGIYPYVGTAIVFNKGMAVPVSPTLTTPSSGSTTRDSLPMLSGTGTANTEVVIYRMASLTAVEACPASPQTTCPEALEIARAKVASDGTFSTRLTRPLREGANVLGAMTEAQKLEGSANALYTLKLDTVAPIATFTSTLPGPVTGNNSSTFSFTATDDGGACSPACTFECSEGSAAFAGCTSPRSVTTATSGTYTLRVRAVDGAGNKQTEPISHTWQVDRTSPDVAFGVKPPAKSPLTTAQFSFTSTATDVADFQCLLDPTITAPATEPTEAQWSAGAGSSCGASKTLTGLTHGSHVLWARAVDAVGNKSSATSYPWAVDLHVPDTAILTGPNPRLTNATTANFTYASYEEGPPAAQTACGADCSIDCSLDGAAFIACPPQYTGLTSGNHTLVARARDSAGNVDNSPANYAWTIDTDVPNVAFGVKPPARSPLATAEFSFTSTSSDVADFQCLLDPTITAPATEPTEAQWSAGGGSSCGARKTLTGLTHGSHVLWVRAVDAATNKSPATSYPWVVDLHVPDTAIVTGPSPVTNATTANFTYASFEEGPPAAQTACGADCSIDCSLDGAAFIPCPPQYTNLTPGNHALVARAKDTAGNVDNSPASYSWRIDTTAPETSIVTRPDDPSRFARAGFDFNSPDSDVARFECALLTTATAPVEADFQTCAASYETPAPDLVHNTRYYMHVRAVDAVGNKDSTPASYNWLVDLHVPDTAIVTGPASVTNATTANFTYASFDEGPPAAQTTCGPTCSIDCSLDGAPFTACQPQYTNLTPGNHALVARAKDSAGNVDNSPASYSWRIDTTAPETSIVTRPDDPSRFARAGFDFNSPDSDVARFECALLTTATAPVEADFHTCAASYETPTPDLVHNTRYYMHVRAVDAVGNKDSTPASHNWLVDLHVPDTAITGFPPSLDSSTTPTFTLASYDQFVQTPPTPRNDTCGDCALECSLNGASYVTCTTTYNPTVREGENTLLVRATDAAHNVDDTPAVYRWRVILGPVTMEIKERPPTTATSNPVALFRFEASKPEVAYECKFEQEADFTPCPLNNSIPETARYVVGASGDYRLEVRARDKSNTLSNVEVAIWTVDLSPPGAPTVTFPAEGTLINDSQPTVQGMLPEPGRVTVSVDGEAVTSFDTGRSWAFRLNQLLTDGRHTVSAQMTDQAGNAGPMSVLTTFDVDATDPETTITVKPPTLTAQLDFTFEFSSSEEVSYRCSLDGSASIPCDPVHPVSVRDGPHTLSVFAVDRAGNSDESPAVHAWTADATPPTTQLIEKPAAAVNVRTVSFRIESLEPRSTFQYSLDGAGFDNCPALLTLNELPEGARHVEVRAVDEAGNVDGTPEVYDWKVDLTAPPVPVVSQPAPDAVLGLLTPTISGTAQAASAQESENSVAVFVNGTKLGTAPVGADGQWRFTPKDALAEGLALSITVQGVDAAGNESDSSAPTSFTIDTTINRPREISSRGGGLSCAMTSPGGSPVATLGLLGLVLLMVRRKRR